MLSGVNLERMKRKRAQDTIKGVIFFANLSKIQSMLMFSVSLAAQYFASTMMIVGMSVVVTVIVLQFHHHDPQGGKMPKWVSN